MPQIDDAAQHHKDIPNLMKELGAIGALGPYIPEEYGGAGLDQISYGLITCRPRMDRRGYWSKSSATRVARSSASATDKVASN
jgi:hypothetical protein